jgi:ABC-type multidrug transport system ATPase subunit
MPNTDLLRAVMKEPAIAILDEPTGTMDSITKNFVADTIRELTNNNLPELYLKFSNDF